MTPSYVSSAGINIASDGSGTSGGLAVSSLTGLQNGDVVCAALQLYSPANSDTVTAPANWVADTAGNYSQNSVDTAGDRWQVKTYHRIVSGDSGTWTWSWTNSAGFKLVAVAIRGCPAAAPFDGITSYGTTNATSNTAGQTSTAGPFQIPTVLAANAIAVEILFNDMGFGYPNPSTNWTEPINYLGVAMQYRQYASTGNVGTVTQTSANPADHTATIFLFSAATAPTNSFAPSVTGTAQQGQQLSTTNGTWGGAPTPTYTYQWKRDTSTTIAGATNSTYTLTSTDVGHTVKCTVTATNVAGSASQDSNSTASVTSSGSIPSNTVAPAITGSPITGQTLTASTGTWDGSPTGYTYQWNAGGVAIGGATSNAYMPTGSDVGKTLTVTVTATNSYGSDDATSSATAAVTAATGSIENPVLGQVINCSTGVWQGAPTLTYQWCQDAGATISGGTATSYTAATADVGHTLFCNVTGTNAGGLSTTVPSNITGVVSRAPVSTAVPTISGQAVQGQTLTATNGTWLYNPTAFADQWKANGTAIAGATTPSYLLTASEVGKTITVTVTASNTAGSASATSAATASVASSGAGSAPVLSVNASNVISWTAISGATGYKGGISTAARGDSSRITNYSELGAGTTWAPSAAAGQTLYYGVAAETAGGDAWCASEVSITWPGVSATTVIGIVVPDWGGTPMAGGLSFGQDLYNSGFRLVRWDDGYSVADLKSIYMNLGMKAVNLWGNYSTGVSGLGNATSFANSKLSAYQANFTPTTAPYVEILNEPYGSWFWGSGANNATNAQAFVNIIKATYTAFNNAYGANRPKLIADVFAWVNPGDPVGSADTFGWWQAISAYEPNIMNYLDGCVCHAYGGNGQAGSLSNQVNRSYIQSAHAATGKPIYITEWGWSTDVGAADISGVSNQISEAQQATNITTEVQWCKSTGYVALMTYFQTHDYAPNNWFGIARTGNQNPPFAHKAGWAALAAQI